MATPFSSIYDLALVSIKDFRLDKLYISSPTDFYNVLYGYLRKAIPNFTTCKTDLSDRTTDPETGQFNNTLTDIEVEILSKYFVLEWLTSQTLISQELGLLLNDTDFKHTSEANVLNAKTALKAKMQEELDYLLVQYGLATTDWSAWASGNFF